MRASAIIEEGTPPRLEHAQASSIAGSDGSSLHTGFCSRLAKNASSRLAKNGKACSCPGSLAQRGKTPCLSKTHSNTWLPIPEVVNIIACNFHPESTYRGSLQGSHLRMRYYQLATLCYDDSMAIFRQTRCLCGTRGVFYSHAVPKGFALLVADLGRSLWRSACDGWQGRGPHCQHQAACV